MKSSEKPTKKKGPAPKPRVTFQFRIDQKLLEDIQKASDAKGLEKGSYVRMLVIERVRKDLESA